MNKYRSHNCNELRKHSVGIEVILSGWINKKRDHGNLLFIDLRDNYGITQCIIDKENSSFNDLEKMQLETVILIEGAVVGTLTGLVGAGGGFLIIPALVLFAGLEMKRAIGTSLIIIAVKSLVGFTGDMSNYVIDWPFLLTFTGIAVVGIFIGSFLATKIDGQKLKTGFGWFVLVMGAFILLKELI